MSKKIIITTLLALIVMAGQAQKHLPALQYSKEPAVLSGRIIKDSTQKIDDIHARYVMKYGSGMGDGVRFKSAALDADGRFSLSLHTGTTVDCRVFIGEYEFTCYVVPGQTVSFTLNLKKLKTQGLAKALTFSGQLADFNHDLTYAREQGFDPNLIYGDIESKRNMGQLIDELPEKSEEGYFHYLDSTYQRVNKLIDNNRKIGKAYREFAKAVNRYHYGAMIPFCAQSIKYTGIDTQETYDAFAKRQQQRLEDYMQNDDPWAFPALSYVMWGVPDTFINSHISRPVKLPADYQQCYLASKYLEQIGKQQQLLSDAQKDSIQTYLPELAQDVLDYNDKLEQKLSFINEQELSRVCTLSDDQIHSDDILSAILKPYRGRPVLLDLWETTCGPCRFAFKDMHDKKKELANRIHFVNIASENSDLATWQRLIPNYIGDHYRLTKQQLQALHRQIPCDTSGVPVWVLVNADGSIHHAFVGWGGINHIMKEISPVLQ